MKYFLLRHEYPDSGFIDGDVQFVPPLPGYYQLGAPLVTDGLVVLVTMDKAVRKLKADFFLTTSGAFFASEKLTSLIKACQNDVHTAVAETRYHNGKPTEKKYFLIHPERRLECFDYIHSEYAGKPLALQRLARGETPDSFLIKGLRALAVDESRANDANFFFVKNVVLIDPVVSESLAEAMEGEGLQVHLESLSARQA